MTDAITPTDMERWRRDPEAFVTEVLVNPETREPFVLTDAERLFLDHAFKLDDDGRLLYPELVFSAPKKSGKTGFAAMLTLYTTLVLGGRYPEAYVLANDLEQAQSRVYTAIRRIVENSPALMNDEPSMTSGKTLFPVTGATIQAVAADYAGAAGANPVISTFDELWAFTSERSHRLWDEQVPPPTRKIACRLTTTYAGFEGESDLLEGLYKRGMKGQQIAPDLWATDDGLLMYWTHRPAAPWQTDAWLKQMRASLRPNQYLRMIENRWVSSESSFVDIDWWDACTDREARPVVSDPRLPVWVGVDASVKRDATAIVVCAWEAEEKRVRLIWHRIFQPNPKDPLDFEATIEETLLDLRDRYELRQVLYDPYQMQSVAQRLLKERVPMLEFPQSVPRLTESSTNLYELIKGRGLVVYYDEEIRLAVKRVIALETSRGWRIAKEKASHKIDVVVALAMAALGAVQQGQKPRAEPRVRSLWDDDDPAPNVLPISYLSQGQRYRR